MNNQDPFYGQYQKELSAALAGLHVTGPNGQSIDTELAFLQWDRMTRDIFKHGRTMFFIGNGASAGMAGHMAADATKNGGLRAMNFNDAPLMTAISNDIDYADCFALPIRRFARDLDLLVTISSSGNSENVVRGIAAARACHASVITLSGMKPDNRSRQAGDLNFYIPAQTYGLVECAHQTLLHCWLDLYLKNKEKE